MKTSKDEKKALLRKMVEIRLFEEKIETLFQQEKIPGFVHLSIGQEASTVGSCSVLREDDYIISTHRGHAHILAKGAEPKYMFAECFGKVTGYCKGKGGSMHIADFSKGILGANGVVGGGFPIMTGAGFSIAQIAWIYIPVLGLWGFGAWRLGKLYNKMRANLTQDENAGHAGFQAVPPNSRTASEEKTH